MSVHSRSNRVVRVPVETGLLLFDSDGGAADHHWRRRADVEEGVGYD